MEQQKRRNGRTIGCVIAVTLGILFLIFAGPTMFIAALFLIGAQPHTYQRVNSPDGTLTAVLWRQSGSMEAIRYNVSVERGWLFNRKKCALADVSGWNADDYTRLTWTAPDTVKISYGVVPREAIDEMPTKATVANACRDIVVVTVHDRSLDAAAVKANDLHPALGLQEDNGAPRVNPAQKTPWTICDRLASRRHCQTKCTERNLVCINPNV